MPVAASSNIDILLIDDDAGDVALVRDCFETAGLNARIESVQDGEDALLRLRSGPAPDLMLLDLNMPRMDGRQLLQIVKSDPALKTVPVIVFTTSAAGEDVERAYSDHANAYVTKPIDIDDFQVAVSQIYDFFTNVARRPH